MVGISNLVPYCYVLGIIAILKMFASFWARTERGTQSGLIITHDGFSLSRCKLLLLFFRKCIIKGNNRVGLLSDIVVIVHIFFHMLSLFLFFIVSKYCALYLDWLCICNTALWTLRSLYLYDIARFFNLFALFSYPDAKCNTNKPTVKCQKSRHLNCNDT